MTISASSSLETLLTDAFHHPTPAIGYYISQQLVNLYPGKHVLETTDSDFNVEAFETDGQCALALQPVLHPQQMAYWNGTSRTIWYSTVQMLRRITWQDQTIDLLQATWSESGCGATSYNWVIADTEAIANDFFEAVCAWNSKVEDEIMVFQDGYWSKSAELFKAIKGSTLDGLILQGDLKEAIYSDLTQFFDSRALYEDYGVPWKRGIILIGPPGNGKTHLVKALINALDKPCLYVKSVDSGMQTDSHNIRTIFEQARESAPCVLILEDLDSLIDDTSRSFFLNEVDGFSTNLGIVIVATTNHPERIDPAILNRPSRFDRKYYLELPALTERLRYIERWNTTLRDTLRLSPDGAAAAAEATGGFSFAYLKELFLSAMMRWIANPNQASMDHVILEQAAILREQMTSAADSE